MLGIEAGQWWYMFNPSTREEYKMEGDRSQLSLRLMIIPAVERDIIWENMGLNLSLILSLCGGRITLSVYGRVESQRLVALLF